MGGPRPPTASIEQLAAGLSPSSGTPARLLADDSGLVNAERIVTSRLPFAVHHRLEAALLEIDRQLPLPRVWNRTSC